MFYDRKAINNQRKVTEIVEKKNSLKFDYGK